MKRQTDGFVRDRGRADFRLLTVLVVASALCFVAAGKLWAADPATYTVDTYKTWLTQYANAKPDFKRGDVLTAKDLERMRPFVPPGYLEQLNFPNFKAQVIDVIPHTPASTYPAVHRAVRLAGQIARRRCDHELHLRPTVSKRGTKCERSAIGIQGGLELYIPLSLFWLLRSECRYRIDSAGL